MFFFPFPSVSFVRPSLFQIPDGEREARILGPILEKILNELKSKKHRDFDHFSQPVSEKRHAGYKKTVKRPMVGVGVICWQFDHLIIDRGL